ncbi:MAG: tyrosine-type recombinase/integrase [Candidatus Bathyarchaeia archaeon]
MAPVCPECGSQLLYKDGLRYLVDGSTVQRWLCRSCGYRFSEHGKFYKNFESNKTGDAHGKVLVMEEEKAVAEKREAGATEAKQQQDVKGQLVEFAWWMKKEGYRESTIISRKKRLMRLVQLGADLQNPETVKEALAKQDCWKNSYREALICAYDLYAKWRGLKWQKPMCRRIRTMPFIPLEREIDDLISGCTAPIAVFLQIGKETGARAGEIFALKWEDVDFEAGTIRITPEKNSDPRVFRVTAKLLSMINNLPKTSSRIFSRYTDLDSLMRTFQRQRKKIAFKLANPRLLKLSFHTLRHWKATMEYAKTKDILHVMRVLGHKNIKNTLVYTHLVEGLKEEEFICRVAHTPQETVQLIEAGFEFVCSDGDGKYFRKRK